MARVVAIDCNDDPLMSAKIVLFRYLRRAFGPAAIGLLWATGAYADCLKDRRGEVYCGGGECIRDQSGIVWCSRFYQGGAEVDHQGNGRCGKGRCVKDVRGRIFCSSKIGGNALRDSRGHVRCYGRCEPAEAKWCENTLAGSSG